ncbi:ribonuclease P protein subunit p29-like [Condylostylus longicornis]|uniref:ribonuclease P protein subunit p29-like n=1 Tax=Condylostylus longicornis TaxID=2530218 RepID=UPI00244E3BDF|nr:ribonuclease P protein subunit p29-like [Condylostylus longicornis]
MEKKGESLQAPLSKEMEAFKELITEIIAPEHRSEIKINPDHTTIFTHIKQKKRTKKPKKKLTTLTRKEYSKLGLYNIPKNSMKYDEAIPLHELWKGYMIQHLSLNCEDTKIPEVYEPAYDNFTKLLMKSDLHGALIKVVKSKCPNFVGHTGIIILETKNVLKIISKDNKIRTLPKAESIFKIMLGNVELTIFGKYLTTRPAEKSVKKIKNNINLDL